MRKSSFYVMSTLALASLSLAGCKEDVMLDTHQEAYLQGFIDRYGQPGDDHTFNMAETGVVTVKSKQPVQVQVLANVKGKYYMFADWNVEGSQVIDFDVPSNVKNIVLYANGQYIDTTIGGTVDLDNVKNNMSRAEGDWDPLTVTTQTTLGIAETHNNGFVLADMTGTDRGYAESNKSTGTNILGSTLKKYVSTSASVYDEYNNEPNSYTNLIYQEFNMTILNINKPDPTHNYEVGVLYGNTDDLRTATEVTYIPVYRTANVVDNESSVLRFPGVRSEGFTWAEAGVEVLIDFSKEGAEGSMEYTITDYFKPRQNSFSNVTKDNFANYGTNSLEYKIQQYYNIQGNVPSYASLRNGVSDVYGNVPALDESSDTKIWEFYDAADAYRAAYIAANPTTCGAADRLNTLIEVFSRLGRQVPDNCYPVIEKEGDKYRVSYYTAFSLGTPTPETLYTYEGVGTSLCNIQDDAVYNFKRALTDVPGHLSANRNAFAIYMKDVTPGFEKVVTTANGSCVKGKSQGIWSENEFIGTGFGTYMLDFDGDGIYNDLVYEHSLPGSNQGNGPTFEPYTWLIACEDLGSTCDNDYNDAVMAVKYYTSNSLTEQTIEIWPMAAGGVYPIYMMWNDGDKSYVVGKEIHQWLGGSIGAEGLYDMINTSADMINADFTATHAKQNYDIVSHEGRFSINTFLNTLWGSGAMGGFWFLVDKDNNLEGNVTLAENEFTEFSRTGDLLTKFPNSMWSVNNQPIKGTRTSIPMIMCVGQDWEWPKETEDITNCYGDWQTWMNSSNPTSIIWYGEGVASRHRDSVVKRWNEQGE